MSKRLPTTISFDPPTAGSGGLGVVRLLIVEPEALFRWSLSTYLRRWFDVRVADSSVGGDDVLAHENVDALVLSADLPNDDARMLAAHARRINPDVLIICTFSGPDGHEELTCDSGMLCLEKPFDLSLLARYLGVATATPRDRGK